METERALRELGFYSGVAGSYYKMVPRYMSVRPLSHDQWEVMGEGAWESVVFPTLEAAVVWLKVEGLCQETAHEEQATR